MYIHTEREREIDRHIHTCITYTVYMCTPPIPSTTCMLPPPIPSTMLPPPISSTMPYSAYGMPSGSLSGVPSVPHPSHLV